MSSENNFQINGNFSNRITFLISHFYRENYLYSLLKDILELNIEDYQVLVLDNSKTLENHSNFKQYFENKSFKIIVLGESYDCLQSRVFLSNLSEVKDRWCFFLDDDINIFDIKNASSILNEILKNDLKRPSIRTFKVVKPDGSQRTQEIISKSKKVKIASNFLGGATLFSPNVASFLYSIRNMRGYGFEEYLMAYAAYQSNIKIIYDPRLRLIHHKAPYIDKVNNISKIRRATGWEMALRKSDMCLKILPIPLNWVGFVLWKTLQLYRWIKEPISSGVEENLHIFHKDYKYKRLTFLVYLKYIKNGGRIF